MNYIACIGSRALNADEQNLCYKIGQFLSQNYIIKTGNAVGADQSYARGVNSIDPTKLWLYLPWESYNIDAIVKGNCIVCWEPKKEWYSIAKELHLYWDSLKFGGKSLHARNVGIIENVEYVVAFPNQGNGGGTGMGMRMAARNSIPVYNLREDKERKRWDACSRLNI